MAQEHKDLGHEDAKTDRRRGIMFTSKAARKQAMLSATEAIRDRWLGYAEEAAKEDKEA